MVSPRVWLVTGTSSGIGRAVTERALDKGDIVVATLRKPEVIDDLVARYPRDRLLVLKVDVTNQEDIDQAFARTKEVFGRLDVVFNNAGYVVLGDAETIPIDEAQKLFNVNFWGPINVSRAAVKFFRDVNEPGRGGVLLQNSSISAVGTVQFLSFYAASKHALDGFSETLAIEVDPKWNIKICIIQPGGFKTNVFSNAVILPENPLYKVAATAMSQNKLMIPDYAGDSVKFARAIYSLVEGGEIPLHLPMGHPALEVAEKKVELLKKEITEATPWSADLM